MRLLRFFDALRILAFFVAAFSLNAYADVKFCSAATLEDSGKNYAKESAEALQKTFKINIFKDFESEIYEDEAALYALKNGLIKFSVVKKTVFEQIGLKQSSINSYGLELLGEKNGYLLLANKKFLLQINRSGEQSPASLR